MQLESTIMCFCLFIHPDFISVECAATAHVHRGGSGDGKK